MTESRFDGLNARSVELFGRPVPQLDRDELTELYRERGIMPRPRLRVIRGGAQA